MTYKTDFKSVGGEFDWISFESLSEYQFQTRWERLLENKGSRFFKLVCEHFNYDYSNAENLPFDSSLDEESLLEQSILMELLSTDRETFFAIIEENNLSESDIYRSFLIDAFRLFQRYVVEKGTIRSIWYKGFKVFTQLLRGSEWDSTSEAQKLSQALTYWINSGILLYTDYFILDISRQIWEFNERAITHVVLACEKDAYASKLAFINQIMGIRFLTSGHGKPSKASSEKIIRYKLLEEVEKELGYLPDKVILLIASDYDSSGYVGVQSGFIKQYSLHTDTKEVELIVKRVGVYPDMVDKSRLVPAKALFDVPTKLKVVCDCKKKQYVCQNCFKGYNKEPTECKNVLSDAKDDSVDTDGSVCGCSDFTEIEINNPLYVIKKDDKTTAKADIGNYLLNNSQFKKKFKSGELKCKNCGETHALNDFANGNLGKSFHLKEENDNWTRLMGVPYCFDCKTSIDRNDIDSHRDNGHEVKLYGIEIDVCNPLRIAEKVLETLCEITDVYESDFGRTYAEWLLEQIQLKNDDYDSILSQIASERVKQDKRAMQLLEDREALLNQYYTKERKIEEIRADLKGDLENELEDVKEDLDDELNPDLDESHYEMVHKSIDISLTSSVKSDEPQDWIEARGWDEDKTIYGLAGHRRDFPNRQDMEKKVKDELADRVEHSEEIEDESEIFRPHVLLVKDRYKEFDSNIVMDTMKSLVELMIEAGIDSKEHGIDLTGKKWELITEIVNDMREDEENEDESEDDD